jgi:hypothetical protein
MVRRLMYESGILTIGFIGVYLSIIEAKEALLAAEAL